MDHAVLPASPAPTVATAEAIRHMPMKSTSLSPSLRSRGKNFATRNMDALHTSIVGETPEARALEDARLANLAERTRLDNLQRALDERARQRVPESSRRQLFQPPQVYRTPVQNLASAARIAESIQPSQSEAGRGLMQIRALLRAAGDQNSAVSQSRNRIHSRSVAADTVQSAHSPRSPPRREGGGDRHDQYRRDEQYDHRFDRDD